MAWPSVRPRASCRRTSCRRTSAAVDFATATDHGTAVAEIVHEMAPDAQLYLVCVDTEVDLAAAEAYAKSQGVHVINHSAGWQGPFRNDGSGPIGAIVADARANGILWVNSAGNEAQTHWSGTYSSGGGVHVWDPNGDLGNTFVWPNGETICGFLKWDEWPAGVSDFDLGLFLSGANVLLASSEEEQTGSQPPFEELCVEQSTGADLTRVLGDSRISRLDLAATRPGELEPAAGVSDRRGKHRRPGVLSGGLRGRCAVLAVEAARALQLAGPDHRRAGEARHRRSRQRLRRDVRRVLVVSVGVRRNVCVLSRGRRCGSSRQAGVSDLRARSGQAAAHAQCDGSRRSGPRQRVRRGRASAPEASRRCRADGHSAREHGSQGQGPQAALEGGGRLGRGERGRARQARRQDGRQDQGEWLRLRVEPEDDRARLEGSCERQGCLSALRPRDRPGGQLEPAQLREGRRQSSWGGSAGGGESRHPCARRRLAAAP